MKVPYRVQEKFPSIYLALRGLYRSSWLYQREIRKSAAAKKMAGMGNSAKKSRNRTIVSQLFDDEYSVHTGPFKNMKYLQDAAGSQLLPKILGSYEEPLHRWIEGAIQKEYRTIIDIGCAEGYYAVGMAVKSPASKIYAYDTDDDALAMCKDLAQLNNVANRVNLFGECTHQELQRLISPSSLIICDIEGYELSLLRPEKVPELRHADMIIEAHDFLYGYGNIVEELINRFSNSHRIEIVVDYPRSPDSYESLQGCASSLIDSVINERRSTTMKWLRLSHF